jgi:hypothetical protein
MSNRPKDRELVLVAKILLAAKANGDPLYDEYLREVCTVNGRDPAAIEAEIRDWAGAK